MGLTPKQEAFCLAYIRLGSASGAYEEAYDTSGSKPRTVRVKGCQNMKNPKIRARIAELQKPAAAEAQVTLAGHLMDLRNLRDKAIAAGKWAAAINAEIARGKASGLYVEHINVTGKVTGDVVYRVSMPVRGSTVGAGG